MRYKKLIKAVKKELNDPEKMSKYKDLYVVYPLKPKFKKKHEGD